MTNYYCTVIRHDRLGRTEGRREDLSSQNYRVSSWLCQLIKLICGGLSPPKILYGKEETFWSFASTLAIAIVKSSARIGLELFSDHSAIAIKTRGPRHSVTSPTELWIQNKNYA